MTTATETFALLKARARLRQLLPVLPKSEDGTRAFSYPSLEGFLYALHMSPVEIDLDTWGYYLDQRLPDVCYDSENYQDDVIMIYEDMAIALEDGLYFKAHTLSIPPSIPADEVENHPLEHWLLGFFSGLVLVLFELKPRSKQLRKSKAYQRILKEFEVSLSVLIFLLEKRIKSNVIPLGEQSQKLEQLLGTENKPLDKFFLFILGDLHEASQIAIEELDEIN